MRTAIFPKDRQATYDAYGYSAAIRSGDLLFVSGQVGVDRDGKAIAGAKEQFAQVFENLRQVLVAAGCSFDDIIDVTSFHVDMFTHFDAFSAAKQRVFPEPPFPNWTAIGAATLADPDLLLEIKVIARVPQADPRKVSDPKD